MESAVARKSTRTAHAGSPIPDPPYQAAKLQQEHCVCLEPGYLCDLWNVTLSITIAALVVLRGRLQPSVIVCLAFMAL